MTRLAESAAAAILLLSSPFGLAGCASAPAGAEVDFVREIEAANRALEASFAAGDLLSVADHYADDSLLLGPDGYRVEGREEIDAYWSRTTDPVAWRLDIHSIEGGGQMAYERGTSHLTSLRDGVPRTSVVEFLLIWRRDSTGRWRIAVDAYWND